MAPQSYLEDVIKLLRNLKSVNQQETSHLDLHGI